MSPLTLTSVSAVTAIALTVAGLWHRQRTEAGELAALRRQNAQLRFEVNARVQREAPPDAVVVPPDAAPLASDSTAPRIAPENYRNEGNATPLAALHTFAWAGDRGDIEHLRQILHLDPGARQKAAAYFAALPPDGRDAWHDADEMVAALVSLTVMIRPFPSADVLATATIEEAGAGRVCVRLPNTPKDRTLYERGTAGWRYVITDQEMDRYLTLAREFMPEPRPAAGR